MQPADLNDLNTIKALLLRRGFSFSRSMGQNFLIDPSVPERMAEASGADTNTGAVEIGPGIGVLTRELARRAGRVVCIELDKRLLPVLDETLAGYGNVVVRQGDALKMDLPGLAREYFPGMPAVACASLPYNITTPAVRSLVEARCFRRITVLVQKEAAQRICAGPGEPGYCELSVVVSYYARPGILFCVPGDSFYPRPSVESAVVGMDVYAESPVCPRDEAFFSRVVRASFAMRRKTLLNGLSLALGRDFSKQDIKNALHSCNFDENTRGEMLGAADFARLSDELFKIM